MSQTQTCRTCKADLPFTSEHFKKTKNNKRGLSIHCKPCDAANERARKQAREDAMTDAEWRAYNARKAARNKAWKANNPERVKASAARYERNERIPKHLDELRQLRRLQRIRDDWENWKARAQQNNDSLAAELGGHRAAMDDPRYVSVWSAEHDLARLAAKGRGWLDRRLDELRVEFEAYSKADITAALERAESRQPTSAGREPALSPTERRWLVRYMRDWMRREAALTDAEKAARAVAWAALLDELDDDACRLLLRNDRKAALRAADLRSGH